MQKMYENEGRELIRIFKNVSEAGQDLTLILDIDKSVMPLGDKLLELGAGIILIKCGTPGLYYRTGSEKVLIRLEEKLCFPLSGWVEREGFEQSYVPEQVLSGTGAGEGASCVESYDALSGLRTLEKIQLKIAKGWKKHPLI